MEEEIFLLLVLFWLSIRKDYNIWHVSSRTCLGSEKVKKNKGSISQLPSPPPPYTQISAPLVFFLALWALLLKPASSCFCHCHRWASTASCFPGECWRRESLRLLRHMLLPIFFIIMYVWKYIRIHFKFHVCNYWILCDLEFVLILPWWGSVLS